ncbi:DNA-methyltransferase [Pantoea stewartii]|uniref:Methyltransferase n=2 Tax=Pantoea stewartii subsp. stewartii DC283 TaxID=660596 RepID=A0ABN4ZCW0_PANSE|nr:site-specific DNA-methyltransferase [Pantoea stewartii]ARF52761.1 DNA adenine methylase [Pantoea stewartii subsp. stewartii DC283]KAB0554005.1 site-specific DNA-methyltransferase [Pantoea stewartii subsp. stewartii]
MTNTVQTGAAQLVCADSLRFIKTLPDNSIDLIATDPPYFRVKDNAWDRQWKNDDAYLAWLSEMVSEFWRVLKPTGSLYMFCGHKLAADTEIMVRDRLNVLNHIIWAKPSGTWGRSNKESLRQYFPTTERVIFAEHYGAESTASGASGYAAKCEELRKQTFKPLIDYFATARAALGVSAKEINQATGTHMCSHWFSESQWQLPKRDQYEKLQELFARKAQEKGEAARLEKTHDGLQTEYDALKRNYDGLRLEYDDLRARYEELRRPFAVTKMVPFTDVWSYPPVQYYAGKHPCEKPAAMMEDIINASSRPGDLVADFFMGSGSTIKAALKLGRRAIGVELESDTFENTAAKVAELHAALTC